MNINKADEDGNRKASKEHHIGPVLSALRWMRCLFAVLSDCKVEFCKVRGVMPHHYSDDGMQVRAQGICCNDCRHDLRQFLNAMELGGSQVGLDFAKRVAHALGYAPEAFAAVLIREQMKEAGISCEVLLRPKPGA
jgi:hypothetical protein